MPLKSLINSEIKTIKVKHHKTFNFLSFILLNHSLSIVDNSQIFGLILKLNTKKIRKISTKMCENSHQTPYSTVCNS